MLIFYLKRLIFTLILFKIIIFHSLLMINLLLSRPNYLFSEQSVCCFVFFVVLTSAKSEKKIILWKTLSIMQRL